MYLIIEFYYKSVCLPVYLYGSVFMTVDPFVPKNKENGERIHRLKCAYTLFV